MPRTQLSTAQHIMHTSQSGFTLIELLVSIMLSVMLIGAAMGLFFITLRSDSKKTSISDLKNDGDYAMNQMEFLLRNAVQLEKASPTAVACNTSMDEITLKSVDNGITRLYTDAANGRIASQSVTTGVVRYLSGSATAVSNLQFDCTQVLQNVGTRIKVGFTLDYVQGTGSLYNETATQNFETTVNIRSL